VNQSDEISLHKRAGQRAGKWHRKRPYKPTAIARRRLACGFFFGGGFFIGFGIFRLRRRGIVFWHE
jgi:hypothetical protein